VIVDLSRTPIAEPLRRLSQERRSGDLEIRVGRVVKTLFFDHGRVVFAASNLKKDRLGEALVDLGRITAADFERAQALMHAEGRRRRFGEALVKAGVMEENEVGRSVARQVDRIVRSLFRFAEGIATFEERRCVIPLEYMVSLSVPRLLYEGIKTMRSEELVLAGLGDLDRRVTLVAVPPFGFDVEDCTAVELEILEQAQRRVTVRKLAWGQRGLEFPRLRAVYALRAGGILTEEHVAEEDRLPVIQMETGTFLLSALQRRPRPSTPQTIQQEIKGELDRSARFDREEWLRVSANAPRDELVRALEEKMERYHLLLDTAGDDEKLRTDVETILGRAWSLLRALQQPGEATNPAAAEHTEPVPTTHDMPQPARDLVQEMLREGDLRMAVADYGSAVEAYLRLVEAAPTVSDHHARLAGAMAQYPPMAIDAERAWLEAIRLAPADPELHYRLGVYYRQMKERSRALAELQTALRLDPDHEAARRELASLSPRDNALTSLRRLFRRRS
jgi:hypothetical protein